MSGYLFQRIESCLTANLVFKHQTDDTENRRIQLRIRLIAARRLLAYGVSFDQTDDLCELGETTCRNALLTFVNEMVSELASEYFRNPTVDDQRCILAIKSSKGFPEFVGPGNASSGSGKIVRSLGGTVQMQREKTKSRAGGNL